MLVKFLEPWGNSIYEPHAEAGDVLDLPAEMAAQFVEFGRAAVAAPGSEVTSAPVEMAAPVGATPVKARKGAK